MDREDFLLTCAISIILLIFIAGFVTIGYMLGQTNPSTETPAYHCELVEGKE